MGRMSLGPELDAARARVVERGHTAAAVGLLTPLVTGQSLESLATVKSLLKTYFSAQPWTAADDDALADAIGDASEPVTAELEPGLELTWARDGGRFRLRVREA
jgi:hypothetical protein